MNADFTSLIEKHLNATLTAAEAAQLAQAMVDDPAVAEHFASLTRLDADLSGAAKEAGRTALYTRRMERAEAETAPAISRRRLAVRTLVTAAGIAVLIGTGWRLIEGNGLPGTFAKKGKSGSAREKSSDDGGFAALAGNHAAADSAAMKRKLRGFFVPMMNVKQLPVSQALAALHQQWKDSGSGAVAFTLADDIRQRWPKPEDEPVVSLEIPGISLLTNLELLAAQSGLKAIITGDGVNLEEDTRARDNKERTWNIPLSQATLTAFMNHAGAGRTGGQTELAQIVSFWNTSSAALRGDRVSPSWMAPTQQVALVDSGLQQSATWNDYSWIELNSSEKQTMSSAWGLISSVQYGEPSAEESVDAGLVAADFAAAQTLTYNLQDTASAQFSPDGKQILTAGLNEKVMVWDAATGLPVAPAETYADYDGDGTIDLNLAPEVIEFDGFINYGTPIETTGINALGYGEPVVLTDSKIQQPVFATRTLIDHPASLTRLLAAHGMPAAGATWNAETGVLTARGTMQSLRAAHVAAAAIRESASAGVEVDMRVIEWKDGQSPPNANMILPPADVPMVLSAADAHTLLRLPSATVTNGPGVREVMGKPVALNGPAGANFSRLERLPGDSFDVQVTVEQSRGDGHGDNGVVSSSASCKVADGAWLRFDFPAQDSDNANTVLLRIQSAEVYAE